MTVADHDKRSGSRRRTVLPRLERDGQTPCYPHDQEPSDVEHEEDPTPLHDRAEGRDPQAPHDRQARLRWAVSCTRANDLHVSPH